MSHADILVSIPMCAYNHEYCIGDAIEGVVGQQTNYRYKLFIGEDCSKDNTRNVIRKYQEQYPDKIVAFFHEKNLGAHENSKLLFKECTSKYIALCDGDDYWIDPNKLQRQVEFLENNPEYVACSTNVFEKSENEMRRMVAAKDIISFADLANGNILYTSSVVYRNTVTIPSWFSECKMGDWVIWLLLTVRGGLIHNFRDNMAVYRIHNNGMWIGKGKEKNLKDMIAAYDIFLKHFDHQYHPQLKKGASRYYDNLLSVLAEKGSFEIFYWSNKAFWFDFRPGRFKYLLKYFKRIILPAKKVELPAT